MENYLNFKDSKKYSLLQKPAEVIKEGGLVLFPTETVYGIGADGLNKDAVKKIYEAKERNSDNPLILHISNMDMLDKIACDISEEEYMLMDAFWPGPFTIILKKKNIVPEIVTGGLNTVAVRMPSNIIANKLIEYANTPIAAPSANISGKPSGTCIDDIYDELASKMDYIIDGGRCEVGLESTVVKVIEGKVKILRPGKITKEDIDLVILGTCVDRHVFESLKSGEKVLSPGMKYTHYAPDSKCILVYGKDNNKMIAKINELANQYNNVTIVCSDENKHMYKVNNIIDYGSRDYLHKIAQSVFSILRKVDKNNPEVVIIEGVEKKGIGLAIMNRLIRACSHNYIEIEE